MNVIQPKKLLLTKWTAVQPSAKNKHFLVSKIIPPEPSDSPTSAHTAIEWIELEAVFSKTVTRMRWQELRDAALWKQGWV
jgi:Tryptophan-rich protein (DUF2389)